MATIQEVLEAFCGVPGPPLPRKARGGLSAELGPNGTYLLKDSSTTICIRYGEYILFTRECQINVRQCGYLGRLRRLTRPTPARPPTPNPISCRRV